MRISSHPLYLALGQDGESRQAAYRALFRSELDEEAIADIRKALAQGQPLGTNRFSETIWDMAGVRLTRKRRGRPARQIDGPAELKAQVDFGFWWRR